MINKLELRAEIKNKFKNETVKNINTAIKISKVIRWMHAESTIFYLSFFPFLIGMFYMLITNTIDVAASATIVLMITHFTLYKILFRKFIFSNIKDIYDEYDYIIEILNEIKDEKIK
jgi:hypothetical protein